MVRNDGGGQHNEYAAAAMAPTEKNGFDFEEVSMEQLEKDLATLKDAQLVSDHMVDENGEEHLDALDDGDESKQEDEGEEDEEETAADEKRVCVRSGGL